MRRYVAASTNTTALTGAGPVASLPSDAFPTGGAEAGTFIFGGVASDGNTLNYRANGFFKLAAGAAEGTECYVSIPLAIGVATFGTLAYGAAGLIMGASTSLLCDTITETLSSGRARILSPADNSIAYLELDLRGLAAFQIGVDIATGPTSMDVFGQLDNVAARW